MRRFMTGDNSQLPPDGWCHNPAKEPLVCSWCSLFLIKDEDNGILYCFDCDLVENRPVWNER